MSQKDSNVPTVRIQERAPKDRWMVDAKIVPSSIHTRTGIVDAADLYKPPQKKEPAPDIDIVVDGAEVQEKNRGGGAAVAAEASRADKLEIEKNSIEKKFILTDKALSEVQNNNENLRTRVRKFKAEQNKDKTKITQLLSRVKELEEDHRTNANEFKEKITTATQRIKELEKQDTTSETTEVEVEVEVYPTKIVVEEILSTNRKNATVILKTRVRMGDELIPMIIRAPFKKMKAAIENNEKIREE